MIGLLAANIMPSFAAGGITGNLNGTITDATGTPVAGATVSVAAPSQRSTSTTDGRGVFTFVGLPVDTYVLSVSAKGYETFSVTGINVIGDQTTNLGTEKLSRAVSTIGRTTGRSRSSAYQPNQTVDEITVAGSRATTALGRVGSTNATNLTLSVPGVNQSKAFGSAALGTGLTIRGGLANEIGYQFDGIPLTEPFNNGDAQNGRFLGLNSLQVVEGAGDPSQGNVGSGVVNFTVKRGTNPGAGSIDLAVGSPFGSDQYGAEYGYATPNGAISEYVAYNNLTTAPIYGPNGYNILNLRPNAATFTSRTKAWDFLTNTVFKFGKDQDNSLQFLYRRRDSIAYGDYGGYSNLYGGLFNPATLNSTFYATGGPDFFEDPTQFNTVQNLQNSLNLPPNYPTSAANFTQASQTNNIQLSVVKAEYTHNFGSSAYFDARVYNQYSNQIEPGQGIGYGDYINNYPSSTAQGGWTSGGIAEFTKQFGTKHTVTIGGSYENRHPQWSLDDTFDIYAYALGNPPSTLAAPNGPSLYDFLPLVNGACPLGANDIANLTAAQQANACYLAKNGVTSKIPGLGLAYGNSDYAFYAFYFRDQFQVTKQLKLDLGVRSDYAYFNAQSSEPLNGAPAGNPYDLPASYIRSDVVRPHVWEPRLGLAYQITPNDAFRATYGRSEEYASGQTFGTPFALPGLNPAVFNVPVLPGTNTTDPATWTCGSGYNPQYLQPGGANKTATNGSLFRCANYGQQLYWAGDQALDAPDAGNLSPPTYSNYDATYQHQFSNGMGVRFTGFSKRGYNLPSYFDLIALYLPDGTPNGYVFSGSNIGKNLSNGVEFAFTTRELPVGLTAYLSATYTNAFNTTPPLIYAEDQLPTVTKSSIALNKFYRVGYISPFTANAGLSYKTKNGFRFNPVFNYDKGYPIGAGTYQASGSSFGPGFLVNGQYTTVHQSNFDAATYSAIDVRNSYYGTGLTSTGSGYTSTFFVDPSNPGNYYSPNISATRGTPEGPVAGSVLSKARLYANMNIEYQIGRNTFGVGLTNVFNNPYAEPALNPLYQAVATGVSGPKSGTSARGYPTSVYYAQGYRNIPSISNPGAAYITLPNNPQEYTFYYHLQL